MFHHSPWWHSFVPLISSHPPHLSLLTAPPPSDKTQSPVPALKTAWQQSIKLFSSDPRNTFPFKFSFRFPFRAMGCTFEYPLEQWRHKYPLLSIQWVRFRIAIGFIPIVPTLFCLSDHFHFCQMLLLFISRNIHEVFRDSFSSSQPLPEGRASKAWST